MPKRYTKALHERVKKTTSDIFEKSVRTVLGLQNESISELQEAMHTLRAAKSYAGLYPEEEIKDMEMAKVEVDEMYLQLIMELSTKSLEEILFIHDTGHIKRMPRTLEAIISEIARRSLLGDTCVSDTNKQYGEMDDARAKTSQNSKATRRKGSKAIKGR